MNINLQLEEIILLLNQNKFVESHDIFEELYESNEARLNKLKEICDDNPNPETINNSKETAPSKRLTKYIRRFKKTSDSINITKNIGLAKIRIKCPNFNDWVTKLENI